MSISYLKSLSDVDFFILFPVAACILLCIVTLLFHCLKHRLHLTNYDSDILDTATQNTMSGAYVVLGFVLVLAMSTVSDLDANVAKEATAIKSLERLLLLDGSAAAIDSRQKLIGYTESVLNDEWPILKQGEGSQQTSNTMRILFSSLDRINPSTLKDATLYSKILDKADEIAALRNNRIFSVQGNLPQTFYLVSLISLFGVVIICALRLMEATPIRIVALSTQISMLALMFSAIVIIDLPYLGDTVTSPDPISAALESMRNRSLHIN